MKKTLNMNEIERATWQFNNNMTYKHDNLMNGTEYSEARATIVRLLDDAAERENPHLLTVEELDERIGKPLWISGLNRWGIFGRKGADADADGNPIFKYVVGFAFGWEWIEDVITPGRNAYDYPPKEEE
jgi:hypothetical protein